MRIDSCRKCGNELQEFQKCEICDETTIFHCARCQITTDEIVHSRCCLVSFDYQLLRATIV